MHNYRQIIFWNKQLNKIYLSTAIKSFGLSMIGIFIPLFLLNLNYTLREVFIFLLILFTFNLLAVCISPKIIPKLGAKHLIILATPITALSYFLLYSLPTNPLLFYITPALIGLATGFYWMGFHIFFAKYSDRKKEGRETSIVTILTKIANVLGPTIGGFIITLYSFKLIFIISIIIMLIGIIPLIGNHDYRKKTNFKIFKTAFTAKKSTIARYTLFAMVYISMTYFWPIYIVLNVTKEYHIIGIAASLSLFITILFVYFIGKLSDKYDAINILKISGPIIGIITIFKLFVTTISQLFLINIFEGFAHSGTDVAINELDYKQTNKDHKYVKDMFIREFHIKFAKVILLIFLIIIPNIFLALSIGAMAGFLTAFLRN